VTLVPHVEHPLTGTPHELHDEYPLGGAMPQVEQPQLEHELQLEQAGAA
jgi:hypothetical protein